MKKRVLVTGITGLIGRQLTRPLVEAGFDVFAITRDGAHPPGVKAVKADLLDPGSRQAAVREVGASHLIHLAWHAAPVGRWTAPENLDWAAATAQLVREFAAHGGKRAVCVGSCAEYDWSYETLKETTPLRPTSVYGQAKASTGQMLAMSAPELGVSLAWARIFFVYGPGEPHGRLLGDLLYGLAAGEPVDCTDGLQERDYLHTADVAAALVAVLVSDLTGPVNIGSGEALRVRDLIEEAARQMGCPEGARLGARARPPDDPPRLVADVARLASTGFRPRHSLVTGVRDCVAAFEGRADRVRTG